MEKSKSIKAANEKWQKLKRKRKEKKKSQLFFFFFFLTPTTGLGLQNSVASNH